MVVVLLLRGWKANIFCFLTLFLLFPSLLTFWCVLLCLLSLFLLLLCGSPVLSVHHQHWEGGTSAMQWPLPRNPCGGCHQPGGPVLPGVQDLSWLDQLHEHHPIPPNTRWETYVVLEKTLEIKLMGLVYPGEFSWWILYVLVSDLNPVWNTCLIFHILSPPPPYYSPTYLLFFSWSSCNFKSIHRDNLPDFYV